MANTGARNGTTRPRTAKGGSSKGRASVKGLRAAMASSDLIEAAATVALDLRNLPSADLEREALDAYHLANPDRERQEPQDLRATEQGRRFLDRICVNHARHRLTGYDDLAESTGAARNEVGGIYTALRKRTYAAIATAYPHLAAECTLQQRERETRQLAASKRKRKPAASSHAA